MSNYGVTKEGFVLKRMDTILEEIHADLTEGFGFDTRLTRPSFLDTLATTFAGQIADLWEVAQESYYSKYPATAEGINLDNAVQYGGVLRLAARKSIYPLHCTGNDGTSVRKGIVVATNTMPEIRLESANEFIISREACNELAITVAANESNAYTVIINEASFSFTTAETSPAVILAGLSAEINSRLTGYSARVAEDKLIIEDLTKTRNNKVELSSNLTTAYVTTIASFYTQDYGEIDIPKGIVTKIITNTAGLTNIVNKIPGTMGRLAETDSELRKSYISKAALRSSTMIDSIVSELLNNVAEVKSASGYQNDSNTTDAQGLPPHSIELVVDGGDDTKVAEAILKRKAGGIATYGNVVIDVPTKYGQTIPVRFNRPVYLYTWIKASLLGTNLPTDYAKIVKDSIMANTAKLGAGEDLLTQLLHDDIYNSVNGLRYIEIKVAYSTDIRHIPSDSEYILGNITPTLRQIVVTAKERIEVVANDS